MLMCQIVLIVQLAEIAVIVQSATLYYNTENLQAKTEVSTNNSQAEQVHLFVVEGRFKPYSFVDDFGKLVGFDIDIVNEVCSVAGRRCHTILAEYPECIFSDRGIEYAGRGIMANWFDGCPGFQITIDRQNEFDFTLPYLESTATFTVALGNPSGFNPELDDYSSFTLLHLTGAPTNRFCLNRLHKKFGQILVANDLTEARSLMQNGTADVLFSTREEIDGLLVLPQRVRCDNGGAGIMLKKGSKVPTWWNPAFQRYFFSGKYTLLCNEASVKYGEKIRCLPTPKELSPELSVLLKAPQTSVPERLWKFVVTGRIAPFSYLNDEGRLTGFTKDMVYAVCKIARKHCVLFMAQVRECTVRTGELLYPGRGLMEGWFDACTGYFNTQDRQNSWDFTSPYLMSNASFFVAQGNPSRFDPDSDDYSAFTIVHQATAITNNHCLNRLHKKFNKLIAVNNEAAAIDMVLNGTADAWFTKEDDISQLEQLPQRLHCENVGTSILTRKGSELPSWWNVAFEEFYSTGQYRKFCEAEGRFHKYNFACVEGPREKSVNTSVGAGVQEGY